MHLLLPLLSSILFTLAALSFKQAATRGVGVFRATFISNWTTALLFMSLWPLGGTIPEGILFWQPAVVALLFVCGQVSTFLAFQYGDVSVTTPVMGLKVILVAWLSTTILGLPVSPQLWAAAGLSFIGVAVINRGTTPGQKRPYRGRAIWFAFQAACAYALFDTLVMKWAPAWGPGRFLPIMAAMSAACSIGFMPLFRAPLHQIEKNAWRPLLTGAGLMGAQAVVLITTLAVFKDGTAVNIVYSARGLWSVVAVIYIGRWFENEEKLLGKSAMRWRLLGASLLCAAIVLVFL